MFSPKEKNVYFIYSTNVEQDKEIDMWEEIDIDNIY